MDVAGVDGCKAGWLIVLAEATGHLRIRDVLVVERFTELLERTHGCAAVAVDIPIGLPDGEPRLADSLARRAIGPRRSSVFPPPVRAVLKAKSYVEACTLSEQTSGRKISQQAYAILPKIKEVDAAITPSLQQKVVEVHPEVCFWALNGHRTLDFWKRRPEGVKERLAILARPFDDEVHALQAPKGAGLDDLLDACAATWSAGRVAYGTEQRFPPNPQRDSTGLRMEIVY